jgi:hypothetical protein
MKPCPKCGSADVRETGIAWRMTICRACGFAGGTEHWNTIPRRVEPRTGPVPEGVEDVPVYVETWEVVGLIRVAGRKVKSGQPYYPAAEVDAMLGRDGK